jgi:hypothetical protein
MTFFVLADAVPAATANAKVALIQMLITGRVAIFIVMIMVPTPQGTDQLEYCPGGLRCQDAGIWVRAQRAFPTPAFGSSQSGETRISAGTSAVGLEQLPALR